MLFNRYVSVRVKNLQTGVVTTISNDFKIEFEYTKYLDESKSASGGSIKIYGLKQETVSEFGQLYSTVELVCGYLQDSEYSPKTLFIGQATEISFRHDNPVSETSIQVSSGFANLNMGKKLLKSYAPDVDLMSVLLDLSEVDSGFTEFRTAKEAGKTKIVLNFLLDNSFIYDYVSSYKFPYGYYLHGTIKESLDEICYITGLNWRVSSDGSILFSLSEALEQELAQKSGATTRYNPSNTSLVLTPATGLIGMPYIKSDVVSENYGTTSDNSTTLNQKTRYKKDGSVNTKVPKKQRVRRYSVACKALIHPSIEPNSLVRLESSIIGTSGLFRVRDVKFTGDNMGDSWFMELEMSGEMIL